MTQEIGLKLLLSDVREPIYQKKRDLENDYEHFG